MRSTRTLTLATAALFAVALACGVSGCTPVPREGDGSPSASELATPAGFEQQLPLVGEFVSQGTETVGDVEIVRHDDGTVWAHLSDFSTGSGGDLRLYLNEGALVKNSEGFWTVDVGTGYEMAGQLAASGTQEIEINGSQSMSQIQSVSVRDYTGPDYPILGSAALSSD